MCPYILASPAPLNINGLRSLIGLMSSRHIHIVCGRRLHALRPVWIRVRRWARPISRRLGRWRRIAVQRLRQMLWRGTSSRVLARWRKVLIERRGLALRWPTITTSHVQVRRVRRYRRMTAVVIRRHYWHVRRLLDCREEKNAGGLVNDPPGA